jgi:hypothetical protein
MCKSTCCPRESGSGLGMLAIIAAVVLAALIARPVIHAAEVLLRIAVIALSIIAALAVITAAAVIATRIARKRRLAVPAMAVDPAPAVLNRRLYVVPPPLSKPALQLVPSPSPARQPAPDSRHPRSRAACGRSAPRTRPSDHDRRWP